MDNQRISTFECSLDLVNQISDGKCFIKYDKCFTNRNASNRAKAIAPKVIILLTQAGYGEHAFHNLLCHIDKITSLHRTDYWNRNVFHILPELIITGKINTYKTQELRLRFSCKHGFQLCMFVKNNENRTPFMETLYALSNYNEQRYSRKQVKKIKNRMDFLISKYQNIALDFHDSIFNLIDHHIHIHGIVNIVCEYTLDMAGCYLNYLATV